MSDQRLAEQLRRIQQAAADACRFVEGLDRHDFAADKRTHQAVVMSLIIIGEATIRIANHYPDFVAAHPDIPWRDIRGMRNRIAHGYFEIDLGIVWDTVQTALPDLLRRLAALHP